MAKRNEKKLHSNFVYIIIWKKRFSVIRSPSSAYININIIFLFSRKQRNTKKKQVYKNKKREVEENGVTFRKDWFA